MANTKLIANELRLTHGIAPGEADDDVALIKALHQSDYATDMPDFKAFQSAVAEGAITRLRKEAGPYGQVVTAKPMGLGERAGKAIGGFATQVLGDVAGLPTAALEAIVPAGQSLDRSVKYDSRDPEPTMESLSAQQAERDESMASNAGRGLGFAASWVPGVKVGDWARKAALAKVAVDTSPTFSRMVGSRIAEGAYGGAAGNSIYEGIKAAFEGPPEEILTRAGEGLMMGAAAGAGLMGVGATVLGGAARLMGRGLRRAVKTAPGGDTIMGDAADDATRMVQDDLARAQGLDPGTPHPGYDPNKPIDYEDLMDWRAATEYAERFAGDAPEPAGFTRMAAPEQPGVVQAQEPMRNRGNLLPPPPSAHVQARAEVSAAPRAANKSVQSLARLYIESKGIKKTFAGPVRADPARGRAIADAYEALPEFDPKAKPSYDALNAETAEQYQRIQDAGYKIEFVDGDPYASSAEMMADVRDNKRLKVFKTGEGQEHPFMTPEQNNIFRAVHDFFGHAKEGNQFGPNGEETAWRAHSAMYTDDAVPAMTTETRGQNSWVNFREGLDPKTPLKDRPFAAQKAALLPKEFYSEALGAAPQRLLPAPTPRSSSEAFAKAYPKEFAELMRGELASTEAILKGLGPGTIVDDGTLASQGNALARYARSLGGTPASDPLVGGPLVPSQDVMERGFEGALRKAEDQARLDLKGVQGTLFSNPFTPRAYRAVLTLSAGALYRGGRKAFASEMVQTFGNEVRPRLKELEAKATAQMHKVAATMLEGRVTPSTRELLKLARQGMHGAKWYAESKAELERLFGADADVFTKFLAATSIQTKPELNMSQAMDAFMTWKLGGSTVKGLPAKVKNITRAAAGDDIEGQKISEFYRALRGDQNAVVIDIWMARVFGFKDNMNKSQFQFMQAQVRQVAKKLGVTPAEAQAMLWVAYKKRTEGPDSDTRGYLDILRDWREGKLPTHMQQAASARRQEELF